MKNVSLFSLLLTAFVLISLFSCSNKPTEPEFVAKPSFNLPAGTYYETEVPILVSITSETLLTTIFYTLDGTNPNSGSPVYYGPIRISTTTTIKAKAAREGMGDSKIASATYTISPHPLPDPIKMVYVPGGTFNNGNSDVTVGNFYIANYELTQAEYQAVMGANPSSGCGVGSNYPVYYVSWFRAIEYSNRLSMQEGLTPCYSYSGFGTNPADWPVGWDSSPDQHSNVSCNWTANGYRLPTEAEWEFAASGGNQTHNYTYSGSNSISEVAWYRHWASPDNTTHSVGGKLANELGLYDMSGNVCEWVWDIYGDYPSGSQNNPTGPYSGSYRGFRGGSWDFEAIYCKVSSRSSNNATFRINCIGFRVCRVSQ